MKKLCSLFLALCLIAISLCGTTTAFAKEPILQEVLQEGAFVYEVNDGEVIIVDVRTSEKDVTVPDTLGGYPVVSIGEWAFNNCNETVTVFIPAGIENIHEGAFRDMEKNTDIFVAADNEYYTSIDGSLYDKEVTTLIRRPQRKTGPFIIPDGVTTVATYALYRCYSYLISECSLYYTVIPASVTSISQMPKVHYGHIFYGGSEEDWAKLEISQYDDQYSGIHFNFTADEVNVTLETVEAECEAQGHLSISCGHCDYTEELEAYHAHGHNYLFAEYASEGYVFECEYCKHRIRPSAQAKKGDANGDNTINSTDFMLVRRYYLQLAELDYEQYMAADINSDGKVNSTDFMQIRKKYLGIEG